jgi:hypothetical protein
MEGRIGSYPVERDWQGVARLDDPARMSLEELVGLDPEEWAIIGLELWAVPLTAGSPSSRSRQAPKRGPRGAVVGRERRRACSHAVRDAPNYRVRANARARTLVD